MHNQIETNLENIKYQHGFRKNHSTTHAALQLVNHINHNLDNQTPTAAIFIDFRKAVNCVCHSTLIDKIRETNLGPNTISWVKNYVSNRTQRVLVNNQLSDYEMIKQGVPQGSILGPLFYILYANDIPDTIKDRQLWFEAYPCNSLLWGSIIFL